MNEAIAYLIGMVLGNGEIHLSDTQAVVSIELPHKNLKADITSMSTTTYVSASLLDIQRILTPILAVPITTTHTNTKHIMSFRLPATHPLITELRHSVQYGMHHRDMRMHPDLFKCTKDEKRELLKGIADTTGYIRRSNQAFGVYGHHRVYIEIPGNWELVIDIANMLKDLDIPVQTIDFGHPNIRDGNLTYYNRGQASAWNKEHQIKIWAPEFLSVGFNIIHKNDALGYYAAEMQSLYPKKDTHVFYWQNPRKRKPKLSHPEEHSKELPLYLRGKHFDSWQELAEELGYHG
jgi:hypothetical protein